MEFSKIQTDIRLLVQQSVDATGTGIVIEDELSLIESGILDSMSIVTLVQSLQDNFDIDIDFADICIQNFDSVSVLVPFIAERMSWK